MSLFPIVAPYTLESFDVSYLTTGSKETDVSDPLTFSSMSFGAASGSRVIIACLGNFNGNYRDQTLATMTIGGVSATSRVYLNINSITQVWIWTAPVPTGTSGDVVVDWDDAPNWDMTTFCSLYRMVAGTAVPSDTTTDNATTSPAPTIDCVAGGVIIGAAAKARPPAYKNTLSASSQAFASTQTGLTVGGSWASGLFTPTALNEDNEVFGTNGISGSHRAAYVAAAFDPA